MFRQWMRWSLVPLMVVLGAVLAVAPIPVGAAAAISAQFGTANGTPAIIVTGSGFGNNETIKISGATNNGQQALYPDAMSDGSGNFKAALYPENTLVTLTAMGQSSNITATVPVNVSQTTIPGITAPSYPGQPYPNQPYPGQPYLPSQTLPSQPYVPGQPYPGQPYLPGQPYPGQPYLPAGQPYPGQPYPGQPYPNQPYLPGQQYPGYAPGAAGNGTTASVGVGQQVPATGGGFQANEKVSTWLTGPDSAVTASDPTNANGQGVASINASFPTPGLWQVTLYGQSSGITVIDRFAVGGTGVVPGGTTPYVPYPNGPGYPGAPGYPTGPSGVPPVPTYRSV